MNIRRLIAVSFVALLSTTALACAAPEEDDADGSNSAISTPRDDSKDKTAQKVAALATAMDKAKDSDFGNDIADEAKPYLDEVLSWVQSGIDAKAELYSFKFGSNKSYLVEMRGSWTEQRVFYAYEATFDGGYAGYFKSEMTPKPLARCTVENSKAAVECKSVASGSNVYEPPAKSTSTKK